MKRIVLAVLVTLASTNVVACSHANKAEDKREVASETEKAEQWKTHQKYLEKIDKIR